MRNLCVRRRKIPLDLKQLERPIAASRVLREMSQYDLARQVGLIQTTVVRVEKAHKPRVAVETLYAIADALGVSTDYLLGRKDTPFVNGKEPRDG
jgi:transcriptional regulator with XRE-family HTH domain